MSDLTDDESVVREAVEKIPGNPQVGLAKLGLEFTKGTDSAEQKK
jgi:fatty acid/phospholipid biosynthesis enzyme